MATKGRASAKESAKALGPDRVPENQKREVYERVRRAVEAKGGVCTQHKVGSSSWDEDEQKLVEEGLRFYPHERHSNMLIYIKIAATLPRKTVRDVAHHLRHMQEMQHAKEEAEAAASLLPAKRPHPDPSAAAAMAAMHEHQMAAMYAASAAGGMATMHALPGMAQSMSGPGGPGPHLKDEKMEIRVCTLLQENMALINSIRDNIMMGRFFDNHGLMLTFDKNVKEILTLLASLPMGDMQKMPVQVNPYFITGSSPYMSATAPPIPQRHHPHPPPHPHPHPPPHGLGVVPSVGGGPVPPPGAAFVHNNGLAGPRGHPGLPPGGNGHPFPAMPYGALPPAAQQFLPQHQKVGDSEALVTAMRSGTLGPPPPPPPLPPPPQRAEKPPPEVGGAGGGGEEAGGVAPTITTTPAPSPPIPTPITALETGGKGSGTPTGATAAAAAAIVTAAAAAAQGIPNAFPPSPPLGDVGGGKGQASGVGPEAPRNTVEDEGVLPPPNSS